MVEFLKSLSGENLVWLTGTVAVILTTLIQSLSKKFKPWSWLARKFGEAMNFSMMEKFEFLDNKISEYEKSTDQKYQELKDQDQKHYEELKRRDDEQDEKRQLRIALDSRRRILRASDEIRQGVKHSEEFFNDILDDMTLYDNYCDENPKFKNHRAVSAEETIRKAHRHCIDHNDFL